MSTTKTIAYSARTGGISLNPSIRKPVIAGNWKMYKTIGETEKFFAEIKPLLGAFKHCDVVVAPPFTALQKAAEAATPLDIGVAAQDLYWETEGAWTGEVSAAMIRDAGCTFTLIGHSERRQYFGETDDTVNRKLKAALLGGLKPIVCVGEVIQEREAGITEDVLRRQCSTAFRGISGAQAIPIAVAYEPVWAIGTGKTATPELAGEAHRVIRAEAAEAFGEGVAGQMRILYGGSVKPENAKLLMSHPDVDGALVGGASLAAVDFWAIARSCG
jgi:triosephosphate isomerase (TIM)